MARINYRSARKNYTCSRCGDTISPGEPYRWAKTRYGPKIIRCMKPSCEIKASELTGSEKLSQLYAVQEGLQDLQIASFDTLQDLSAELETFSEQVTEVAEMYRESAQNIEDGFGHSTWQSEELESKADEVESWADEIHEFAAGIESIETFCTCTHELDAHEERKDGETICLDCSKEQKEGVEIHGYEEDVDRWQDEAADLVTQAADAMPSL